MENKIKLEINDENLIDEPFQEESNKKKSPPANQKASTSTYLDSTKQPLWDIKKVVSTTRAPATVEAPSTSSKFLNNIYKIFFLKNLGKYGNMVQVANLII